jgi:hypothetical protein
MDAMRPLFYALGIVVRACLCLFVSVLVTFVSPISDPLVTWSLWVLMIIGMLAIRPLRRPLLGWVAGEPPVSGTARAHGDEPGQQYGADNSPSPGSPT